MTTKTKSITTTTRLDPVPCCSCGLVFGLPVDYIKARQEDHKWFKCPNGHNLSYGAKSDAEKEAEELRRDLDAEKGRRERAELARISANDRAETASRSARAHKGHATRIKKRVAAGVCPCCNRTFQDLARHMEGQHPGFVEKS